MRPRDIVHAVALMHGINAAAIYGRDRDAHTVQARAATVVALRDQTAMSYPEIGRLLGRDHTTIIAAERRYRDRPPSVRSCLKLDCDRTPVARGLCSACYRRAHRRGVLPPRRRAVHNVPCTVAGCDRRPKGRGLCSAHYQRLLKSGDVQADVPVGPAPGTVTRDTVVDDATHGTLAGYQQGCGCLPCRQAKHVHTVRHRRGQTDRQVPAVRARAHVERLLETGMTVSEVAAAAGVTSQTIRRLRWADRVLGATERAVLAVVKTCEDCDRPALAGGRWCQVGGCRPAGRWSWSRSAA